MSRIILDISANTHKNDWDYLKRMLDELKEVDTGKHEIIIKHQLFVTAGENIPLDHDIFDKAYEYTSLLGYKTTSSVFDKPSLEFLLKYNPCFVKIANNRKLDYLIGEIPRRIPVYVSVSDIERCGHMEDIVELLCVSEYPAKIEQYNMDFSNFGPIQGISDHTTSWYLFNKYKPAIYEVHYKLSDSTGLDAGPFARTPNDLREVL